MFLCVCGPSGKRVLRPSSCGNAELGPLCHVCKLISDFPNAHINGFGWFTQPHIFSILDLLCETFGLFPGFVSELLSLANGRKEFL